MNLDCGHGPMWLAPHDTIIRPLLQKASNQAWCPNKLQGLLGSQNCAPSLIWYFSNLVPPVVYDQHQDCTKEQCNSLHVRLEDYETKHVQPGCQCQFYGPLREKLADIVSTGSIATFTVRHEGPSIRLALHDQAKRGPCVAVSHVWADGCGNQQANELPACVLSKLQDEVNALALTPGADTPLWIDVICLPRYPVNVRRQAISRLSDIFDQASGVLVRDSYLRSLACANMNPIEILGRISISGWTQRLWTFSEGVLAQRIWFQFHDAAIDLFELVIAWEQQIKAHRVPSLASTSIAYEMTALYLATGLQSKANSLRDLLQLSEIRAALSTRRTSWASDEALCLGAALHLDLTKIAKADDNDKMAAFWLQVPYLPSGIVFAPNALKLTQAGVRWAPRTLLGGSNQSSWFQFVDEPRFYATPSADGLIVTLPAMDFEAGSSQSVEGFKPSNFLLDEFLDQDPTDAKIVLRAASGLWYKCWVKGDWHQVPIELNSEVRLPAILLHIPVNDDLNDSRNIQLDDIKWFEGLFVTFTVPSSSDPAALFHAKAHFHLKIERLSSEMNKFLDKLSDIATSSSAWYQGLVSKTPAGDEEEDEDEDKIFDVFRGWVADHPAKDELLDIAVTAFQSSVEEALDECADYAEYFFLVGEWYKTDASYKNWCID